MPLESKKNKLAIVVTEDWVFVSHRLPLGIAAQEAGYDTVVITRCREHERTIKSHGLRTKNFEMNRRGMTPVGVVVEAIKLWFIYRQEKPDLVHHVALRSVVVGGLAAKLSGQKHAVAAMTGLGFLFTGRRSGSVISQSLGLLLPWLLSDSAVIVQNTEDYEKLREIGVKPEQLRLIRGSGVNTKIFQPMPEPDGPPVVMLHARILWDKGVGEFVEAAKLLKARGCNARFVLVGEPDTNNPAAVTPEVWNAWNTEGIVECWGHQCEIAAILPQASVVCLPSYREGLPRSLLEALACGRPCVTTDTSGCREAVRDGDNGFLVPVGDAAALAKAIERLIDDPEERKRMGKRGRIRALREFDESIIIKQTLDLYDEVLSAT